MEFEDRIKAEIEQLGLNLRIIAKPLESEPALKDLYWLEVLREANNQLETKAKLYEKAQQRLSSLQGELPHKAFSQMPEVPPCAGAGEGVADDQELQHADRSDGVAECNACLDTKVVSFWEERAIMATTIPCPLCSKMKRARSWLGGHNPVKTTSIVEVWLRDGSVRKRIAGSLCWRIYNRGSDIIAYRVVR